jgi:hypothetical protein
MGGHAVGKSTLFRWGQARVGAAPGYTWHTEGGNGGKPSLSTMPVEDAVALAVKEWLDPALHTLVVEGTRVYGPIFRVAQSVAQHAPTVGRELWILQLLQTPDVMRAHLQARCAAKGKAYRADYWEQDYQATYQAADRHINALQKFLPKKFPVAAWEPPIGQQLTLWVELGHTNLGPAYTWFANALRVPIIPRTPVRLEEHRPVRTPVRLDGHRPVRTPVRYEELAR